jgi:hypothetical protein
MKCIKCGGEAEYIYINIYLSESGSFCRKCLDELKEENEDG